MEKAFFVRIIFQGFLLLRFLNGWGQVTDTLWINSVSVLPGGEVSIDWTLQTSVSEGNLHIVRQFGGFPNLIAENLPLTQTTFVDNGANAALGAHSYFVAAFNQAGQTLAVSRLHRTIFLMEPEADFCSGDIRLQWTNYAVNKETGNPDPLEVPFDSLRVQYSPDGISFGTIATFQQPPASEEVQEYFQEGLAPGQHFFRIQSFNSLTGVLSNSNVRFFGYDPPVIEDFRIDYVDIFENQEIQVAFSGQQDTDSFFFEMYRSAEPETGYEMAADSLPLDIFTDFPDLFQGPWFYRVKARLKDWECELPAYETMELFSSIFLEVEPSGEDRSFVFSWEHFFPEDLEFSYDLLMKTATGAWETVPGLLDGGPRTLVFKAPSNLFGSLVFKMEAYENGLSKWPISSNYVAIEVEPVVFIPNAFRPSSSEEANRVFNPVFYGFEPEEYELTIFNRWGQVIFTSTDPTEAWNGDYDSHTASPGVYPYQLRYQVPGGKAYQKSGVVVLVN